MKKFWPLLVLVTVILVTSITHYVQFTNAQYKEPIATLTAIQGDATLLDDVLMKGSFDNRPTYASFEIRQGSIYPTSRSFMNATNPLFVPLMDKYGTFMRGKMYNTGQFYEAANGVVYVESMGEHMSKTIDVTIETFLNDEEAAFAFTIPTEQPISWTTTQRITMQQQTLYILISVMFEDGTETLYGVEVDGSTQQLIEAKQLIEVNDRYDGSGFLTTANDALTIQHEDYFVYTTGTYVSTNDEDYTVAEEHVHVWNTVTNTHTSFTLPTELNGEDRRIIVYQNLLLVIFIQDGQLNVARYNLDTQQWLTPIVVDAGSDVLPTASLSVSTSSKHVYMSATTIDGPIVSILDPTKGSVAYIGHVTSEVENRLTMSLYYVVE